MSSEDSENEEQISALKDALQCTFVQHVFDSIHNNSITNTIIPQLPNKQAHTENSFENNIAKILAKRLDENIKEITVKHHTTSPDVSKNEEKNGIQLFTSSGVTTAKDLSDIKIAVNNSRKFSNKKNCINSKVYKKRAVETAVSPEWVCSKLNTKHWQDNKRQRVINMKAIKSLDKNKIVCLVMDNNCEKV